ncbi:methyltransferase [Amycolatopsis acidicola]|uniref:Methyltransferase n=1 Tax=Amycolatopsis acidicola TaxID=2596893 RepID=A0A5N0VNX9_9PSEU|nr:methyltransferase [Amycolatopsis acidicola]KAA9166502.1 methyltransferase [Amycolatopsis acidicola]
MILDKVDDAPSILRLGTAYAAARILHSAVEIGLFEAVQDEPAGPAEICSALGLNPRLVRDFLDALVVFGLLDKDNGRYASSEVAKKFLVPGGSGYVGGRIRIGGELHYRTWLSLTDALRDGQPKADIEADAKAYERLYADPERTRVFLAHMEASNAIVAPQLDECLDWAKYESFVDVGGSRGQVAGILAQTHSHLHGAVFDFPLVRPYFDELMDRFGTTGRVTFHPGDFFTDPIPAADVYIIGHVLHDWPVPRRREIIKRVFEAARPGSLLVVYDQMLDEHDPDLQSLLGSLNVGLITPGGSEYTVPECRDWAESAGFRFREARRLPVGNDSVLIAEKTA